MNAYQKAVRDMADERRAAADEQLLAWRSALAAHADLLSAYQAYQDAAVARAGGEDRDIDSARKALESLCQKYNVSPECELPVSCPACKDTGFVNGRYCKCVINRVINSDPENLTLPQIDFNAAMSSAPGAIKKIYEAAENYIDCYPDGEKPFFVVAGSSGVGKTMLLSAMATALMQKGASAITVSAFEFLRRAKDYHTQFSIEDYVDRFTPMTECDLLCIDDLGTENLIKNITREYLFTVINERWLRKKHTIVTTNLMPDALVARYGETVFSRLYDKTRSESFLISAGNKRLK